MVLDGCVIVCRKALDLDSSILDMTILVMTNDVCVLDYMNVDYF